MDYSLKTPIKMKYLVICVLCFYFACPFPGRVRYKFASFWNRNHAFRALQRARKNYHGMLEAEKKVDTSCFIKFIVCGFIYTNFSGLYFIYYREMKASSMEQLNSRGFQAQFCACIDQFSG